jgi:hypothetical protein
MLEARGLKATLRMSKGSDILAGCGQLGVKSRKKGFEKKAVDRKARGVKSPDKKARATKSHDKRARSKKTHHRRRTG